MRSEIEKELLILIGKEKLDKLLSFQKTYRKFHILVTFFHRKYRVLIKLQNEGKKTRYCSVFNSITKKEAEKVRNLIRLLLCYN